jgi:hypothetical protein
MLPGEIVSALLEDVGGLLLFLIRTPVACVLLSNTQSAREDQDYRNRLL